MKLRTNTARIMIFVAVIFCSSVLLYTNIVSSIKEDSEITVHEFKENQFKSIWMYLEILQTQAEQDVTRISKDIENDLLALPKEELKSIEEDMTNNIHNDILHDIIMDNVQHETLNNIDNHRNGLVIMSIKGFMEDFNYRRAQNQTDDNKFRSWQDSINYSYNKELEKNAIDRMLNRTSGIIAFESYDLVHNNDHTLINELDYNSLLQVYVKEGIEGLRNYQIFVPYYITDIGDIFGQPDISQGIKVENNKIIVAQEFNLYDQIMANDNDIFNDNQINEQINSSNRLLNILYIFGIGLVAAMFAFILYFCSFHNNIVLTEELKEFENEQIQINIENTDEEIK